MSQDIIPVPIAIEVVAQEIRETEEVIDVRESKLFDFIDKLNLLKSEFHIIGDDIIQNPIQFKTYLRMEYLIDDIKCKLKNINNYKFVEICIRNITFKTNIYKILNTNGNWSNHLFEIGNENNQYTKNEKISNYTKQFNKLIDILYAIYKELLNY